MKYPHDPRSLKYCQDHLLGLTGRWSGYLYINWVTLGLTGCIFILKYECILIGKPKGYLSQLIRMQIRLKKITLMKINLMLLLKQILILIK